MAVLEAVCRDGIDLICVMAANNEMGTLYPVEEVARVAGRAGARTLIDATQAAGRVPIHAAAWDITYLTVSAHKIYGPKGVGALIVPPELDVRPSHPAYPPTIPPDWTEGAENADYPDTPASGLVGDLRKEARGRWSPFFPLSATGSTPEDTPMPLKYWTF
jgi:selenocysteine lyase/cysteine desulfurase